VRLLRWTAACVGLAILALAVAREAGGQVQPPTIKDIMTKLHKGADSPLTEVRAELQEDEPNWSDVQKHARAFVVLGSSLGKAQPPKGDRASWAKLTAQYLDSARALDAAAQKRNKAQTLAAHGRLNATCKGCHAAHRPD
jgi:hypothetical protein